MSDDKAQSGSLSPTEATKEVLRTGREHLNEPLYLTFLKSVMGGLLISAAGVVSLTVATGSPSMDAGQERLLMGVFFPIGLVIIYFVGAELYTGYPLWFTITALQGEGTIWQYASKLVATWLGDLVGVLGYAYFFTFLTKTLHEEPFRSGVVDLVQSDVIDIGWGVIFMRAIPCGFLVTLAMFLGTQNRDGISKAIGLHLPFLLSVVGRYPHTVEYMFLTSIGIMLGADLGWGAYFWKALLPITLGNTVGGALLTGAYHWFVYIKHEKEEALMGGLRLDE